RSCNGGSRWRRAAARAGRHYDTLRLVCKEAGRERCLLRRRAACKEARGERRAEAEPQAGNSAVSDAEAELPFAARTIPALAFEAAERFGDAAFLEDGGTMLSFRGFADAVVRAARAFLAASVAPGDRVALWAPNEWEWVVAAVGIQAAGGVLVPLSTRLKGREAGFILRKSAARLLVVRGGR